MDDEDSGRGTAATSVGARTGGRGSEWIDGRRGPARTAAWRVACVDLKALRCAGCPREGARPWEGAGGPDAEAARRGVRAHDVASWRRTVPKCPYLKAKNSKNLNRTPPNFEYESCRAHLGEYFS
jgi:hypothetical protein